MAAGVPVGTDPFSEMIVNASLAVVYNLLLEKFEQPFTISKGDPDVDRRVADSIRSAMSGSTQVLLRDDDRVDVNDLLVAFRRIAAKRADEICVVGISARETKKRIASVAGAVGDAGSVGVPKIAVAELRNRITQGIASKAVVVHNHPRSFLHFLLDCAVLGPSSQDRVVAMEWVDKLWTRTGGLVETEFYVMENRIFRRFVFPPWDTVAKILRKILGPLLK